MTTLEEVTQLKNQGMPDAEITTNLQQKGVSPKEINDALNQSQIKNAISNQEYFPEPVPQNMGAQVQETPSLPDNPASYKNEEEPYQEDYEPQPQQEYYAPQENYSQQEYYPQENYDYNQEGYDQGTDTSTIIEISEQVFIEKSEQTKKQIKELIEFKTLTETKIDNISDRLKRIEKTIDNLQISILDKIGSYGTNLNTIKKEMGMMQDSFSKVINPVLDKAKKTNHSKKK